MKYWLLTISIFYIYLKMGETSTASVIHESVTGVDDDLHPNQKEESKEAVILECDELFNPSH